MDFYNIDNKQLGNSKVTVSSQDIIKNYVDDKRIALDFLQDTAPTTFTAGNKWLSTTNNQLFTAKTNTTWGAGVSITTDQIFTFNNELYHFNGTNVVTYSTDTIKEQNAGNETKIWVGTQNEYDNLSSYDPNTIYNIIDNTSTVSTLLATQEQFNNNAQDKAATPYQVNQSLGNLLPLSGGNFDTGATIRFTNSNGTNSITYDNNNTLNITNNASIANNLTANTITTISGNIYKTNTSGAKVIWSDEKGAANGVASLDADSKIPSTQLPLATNATVGAVRGDGTTTSVNSSGVISVIGGGTGAVTSVNGKTGTVVLTASDVNAYSETEVDDLLDAKQDTITD